MQYALALALTCAASMAFTLAAGPAVEATRWIARGLFAIAVGFRVAVMAASRRPEPAADLAEAALPAYTVLLPLYREAAMVPGLVRAIAALDYPSDRLQVVFALERDDAATRAAVARWAPDATVSLAPADGPKTKPNALNAALELATGEFVVVYDAEDAPDRAQLREAAARFALDRRLVCLQAPLRVIEERDPLRRQFALEYAALFEVALPGLARLGLAFPLGGAGNHFRRRELAALGGWDAWNVTEDADIGLRLGSGGGRLGVLRSPVWEAAPPELDIWTPQRTRWIKGHLHTWLVHMRTPFRGGLKGFLTLQATLGLGLAATLFHGPAALGVAAVLTVAAAGPTTPALAPCDLALLLAGWGSAIGAMALGARRAGLRMHAGDALRALVYWPMQSLAAVFALWELVLAPHRWNKTPHEVSAAVIVPGIAPGTVPALSPRAARG